MADIDVGNAAQAAHELTVTHGSVTAGLSKRNEVAAGGNRTSGQRCDVEGCGIGRQTTIDQAEIGANDDLLGCARATADTAQQRSGTDR